LMAKASSTTSNETLVCLSGMISSENRFPLFGVMTFTGS
jgi:hypothetical protein